MQKKIADSVPVNKNAVSDSCPKKIIVNDVKKIEQMYGEKEEGKPMFLFNVTMQNHGGYTDQYPNFRENIRMTNGYYSDVNQYLSLVNKSDQALEKLITYFSGVDEKVEIVFLAAAS